MLQLNSQQPILKINVINHRDCSIMIMFSEPTDPEQKVLITMMIRIEQPIKTQGAKVVFFFL